MKSIDKFNIAWKNRKLWYMFKKRNLNRKVIYYKGIYYGRKTEKTIKAAPDLYDFPIPRWFPKYRPLTLREEVMLIKWQYRDAQQKGLV